MPGTERELAEDAVWKQIQKNTFTRWCNEHLKCVNKRIGDLETDFSDGLRLISLLEILSQKKMGKYNSRPNFRQMKLENVSVALQFLDRERIKLVSIDSKAIVDGNMKLILGLIWTLILHYSISLPMWDEEVEQEQMTKATPKQRLLGWIQNKIPQMPITNFNKDWRDGIALGALVDNCAPGLCPDWEEWNPEDNVKNADEAMKLADEWLGVPQVITPEEITNDKVDEQSVMTYLSQFPKAKLKPGAPLRPRTNAKKARAYGKGVEPTGLKVGAPAPFTVETFAAGNGTVRVYLTSPTGQEEELTARPNDDKLKTYSVVYHPMMPGEYKVVVLFAGQDIQKSPFFVNVDDTPVDPSQVYAKGPGLQNGIVAGKQTYFDVFTDGAGVGNVDVDIAGPDGVVRCEIIPMENNVYRVQYTPRTAGDHNIRIYFAGHEIPKSPYCVRVSLPLNPNAVWAEGPGIEPHGVDLLKKAVFRVHTENAGEAPLDVQVVGPRGLNEPVTVDRQPDGVYHCTYLPNNPGQYTVVVNYGGESIPKSPFRVNVATPADPSQVRVQGPGIEPGNVVGVSTHFDVITSNAGTGDVDVTVLDDDRREVPAAKETLPNGSVRCTYIPMKKGKHIVKVNFAGEPVPSSPFRVEILPASNANACRVYGRGIQPHGVRVNEKALFHVSTKGAGDADLKVDVKGPRGHAEPVKVRKSYGNPDTYDCEYNPQRPGDYTVEVQYGGKQVPKSPFRVSVGKEAGYQKVRAYGPGLHGGKVGSSADFVVETTGTEVGQLGFSIEGPSQAVIDCQDKGDGSCQVKYFPTEAGEYAVHIMCDDEDIKDSPFMAQIEPENHETFPERVTAHGPGLEENGPVAGVPTHFTVDARRAGKPAPLTNTLKTAAGEDVPVKIEDNGDNTYTCKYTPKEAIKHTIIPAYDGVAVNQSPFRVMVQEDSHPENVRVYGPGVEPGLKAEEPTHFMVDCTKAGSGDISIGLKCTPTGRKSTQESDIPFDIVKNNNDTFTVKYTPPSEGIYTVMVLFADVEIPESPIKVKVDSNHDAKRVYADGPGIQEDGVESGKPTYFTIHTRGAGNAEPAVRFLAPRGEYSAPASEPEIVQTDESTYTVKYTPTKKGKMDVEVCYGGDEIPKSPFKVNVSPALDLEKVNVTGIPECMEVGVPQEFEVDAKNAGGKGDLEAEVIGPSKERVPLRKRTTPHGSKYTFTPKEEGPHRVDVVYDGIPVKGSPFLADAIVPADAGKVRAYGPGLKGGKVGEDAPFTVDTRSAGNGGLGVTIEGPCEAKIVCTDNGDGTCSASYLPTAPGDYKVNILFADEHIPGSPFTAEIEPVFDASKVDAKLQDLDTAKVGERTSFVVDCSEAGKAPLEVKLVNEDGSSVPGVRVRDTGDGVHNVSFIPNKAGNAELEIKYGGEDVPKTPKKIKILPDIDTSSVKTYGPGVEREGVLADVETEFTVEAKRLARRGGDHIHGSVITPTGEELPIEVTDSRDGTYKAKYTPFEPGKHDVIVEFDGVGVPGSAFPVEVKEGCDASKVKAYGPGLEKGIPNAPAKFAIDTRGAGAGGLGLAVEGPSDAKITCNDGKDGTCEVEYLPTEPGDYEVNVTYGGANIPGSPFVVPIRDVVDPSKVVCSGPGVSPGVRMGIPQKFTVDCSKAGDAPLDVAVKGPRGVKEPVEVVDNNDGTHTACYTPSQEGPYQIQVRYAEEDVPRMPMRVRVQPTHDASKVTCSGPGIGTTVPASLPVEFVIDAKDAGEGVLAVRITDPEGSPKKAKVTDNGDGTYNVAYIPDKSGRYTIAVMYGGDKVPYSPYRIRAMPSGNADKCVVTGDGLGPIVPIGQEAVISMDTKKAGPGKATCDMTTPDGGLLDLDVVENKDDTSDVFYTPLTAGPHVINLRYGGEMVPNSPFHVKAVDSYTEQTIVQEEFIEAYDAAPAHRAMNGREFNEFQQPLDDGELRAVNFMFEIPDDQGRLTTLVRMPSGATAKPTIKNNKDNSVSISYQPTELGLHEMDILLDSDHIPGSPIQFYVDAITSGNITAHGPGLSTGKVDKPANFTVVTKDAGAGGLALAVEGPSKADIKCVDNKDGTCSVSYIPTAPGQYTIAVKFDDKHIPGSPFTANISDSQTAQTAKLTYGSTSDIALKINERDLSLLTASIRTPSGQEDDCKLKYLNNGHIGISFTPHEVGEHLVSVKKRGRHITNSPFKIQVGESEIGDASKVRVYGEGIEKAYVSETAEFFVDTRKAGYGGLGLSIEGPSKVDINCQDEKDGICKVTYTPQEPGNYVINIKFADNHVPGSPFTVKCAGDYKLQKESILRQQEARSIAAIGSTCDLNVKIPKANMRHLTATVTNEAGETEKAEIIQNGEHSYSIQFVPKMLGLHTVSVLYLGEHVPGSPFQFTVGPLGQGGAGKVTVGGPGLEKATVNVPAEFNIWTHEAGAGGLSIAVEGPSKAEINFEDRKDGSCGVSYIATEAGDYEISVKFNEEHIPGSPFPVTATGRGSGPTSPRMRVIHGASNAAKVTTYGNGLSRAIIGDNNTFTVDCSSAGSNMLLVGVHGPQTPCEEVFVKHVGNRRYTVTYTAKEPGEYTLIVKWGEDHIPGSPFHVTIP